MSRPDNLEDLLDRVDPGPDADRVSVADLLHRIGEDSFAPLVLVPALLLVSPLSAIPGTPTIGALIVLTITLQWLLARRHLWLPGMLMRRSLAGRRLHRAVSVLRPYARWFDAHARGRWQFLTLPPFSLSTKIVIVAIAMTWPLLELLPMVTSVGAGAVSLLTFGMMMRDGLYICAGYATVGTVAALVLWLTGSG